MLFFFKKKKKKKTKKKKNQAPSCFINHIWGTKLYSGQKPKYENTQSFGRRVSVSCVGRGFICHLHSLFIEST